jgi:hypothetical protein
VYLTIIVGAIYTSESIRIWFYWWRVHKHHRFEFWQRCLWWQKAFNVNHAHFHTAIRITGFTVVGFKIWKPKQR